MCSIMATLIKQNKYKKIKKVFQNVFDSEEPNVTEHFGTPDGLALATLPLLHATFSGPRPHKEASQCPSRPLRRPLPAGSRPFRPSPSPPWPSPSPPRPSPSPPWPSPSPPSLHPSGRPEHPGRLGHHPAPWRDPRDRLHRDRGHLDVRRHLPRRGAGSPSTCSVTSTECRSAAARRPASHRTPVSL